MRKIMLVMIALLLSVQSCLAAEITEARFNDSETLIYPVVHVEDAAIEQRINDTIREEILRFVKEIHYVAQYRNSEIADIHTKYEIGSNEAGNTIILSVILTESSFFKMAAHPSTYIRPLNFNLSSGELMGIDYLVEVGDGFQDGRLLERLNQKLAEKVERGEIFLFENALPVKELPQDFYWDKNLHVHFIFQHYAIASYAAGIIDVDID